ncbi:MAG: ion transporter, partial [Polyangiaceae bacterium]
MAQSEATDPKTKTPSEAPQPSISTLAPGAQRQKLMSRARAFEILGASRAPRFDDLYLKLLARPWRWVIGVIVVFLLLQNLIFAVGYWLSGGINGTTTLQNDFARAFFFSVETLGTIGYGTMYPTNMAAHVLVTIESITGILSIALITGVIFAKFSRIRARVLFSKVAVVSMVDGVPTLMVRVANERGNYIADATVTVTLLRIGKTKEGHQLARMQDLRLTRNRSPAFTRTWLVMHPI